MSLSSTSNTINALGIFGRLDPKQEQYFKSLQAKYKLPWADAHGIHKQRTKFVLPGIHPGADAPGTLPGSNNQVPQNNEAVGIFSHLSLVIEKNVPVGKLSQYLDALRELKPFLPCKLKTNGVIVKDGQHLALSFDTSQTQKIRDVAQKIIPEGVVTTHYTKVVWFVPKENQQKAIKELENTKEMIFYDFKLVANRQDDTNTIYSSFLYT